MNTKAKNLISNKLLLIHNIKYIQTKLKKSQTFYHKTKLGNS